MIFYPWFDHSLIPNPGGQVVFMVGGINIEGWCWDKISMGGGVCGGGGGNELTNISYKTMFKA